MAVVMGGGMEEGTVGMEVGGPHAPPLVGGALEVGGDLEVEGHLAQGHHLLDQLLVSSIGGIRKVFRHAH